MFYPSVEEMAFCELYQDPIFNRISKEKCYEIIKNALKIGKEYAAGYNGAEMKELIKSNQILLSIKQKSKYKSVNLRGEYIYSKKKNEIIVYENSIESLAKSSKKILPEELAIDYEKALEIHLAHEFFHYIEFNRIRPVSETEGIDYQTRLLKKYKKIPVIKASEIAAHSFSFYFCKLSIFPNFYDYVYLQDNGGISLENLKKICDKYDKEWR